jgi:hypothetical protein
MRYEYVVVLRRDSDRAIDTVSVLLCCFSALNFIYEQTRAPRLNYFILSIAVLLLGGMAVNLSSARKKRVRYKYLLLIAFVGWLAMPYLQWLAIFFVALAFLEYQAKYPLEIGFLPDRVVVNTLWRKKFGWSAFNNIMLRDGLLTLDFKNNRLMQKEVDEEEEGDADEDEFNDYCREMLERAQYTAD